MNYRLHPGRLLFLLLLSVQTSVAQPYGLNSRPAIGAYLNGAVPPAAPQISGNWSAVVAFTNLTFLNAVGLTYLPGTTKLVVWEREGRIYHFDNTPAAASKTLVLNITNQCQGWDDSGLLGVAFHPGFVTNRYMFVWYTWVSAGTVQGNATQRPPTSTPNRDRLSRFTLDANGVAMAGTETVFIDQSASTVWHNGGGTFFGDDGFLYVTNGDDATGSNNQIINRSLFSGVLRIDVDRRGGGISHAPPRQPQNGVTANYYIPNSNPFVGVVNALEEFFAIGLRSPHRMTFDPVSRRIFIGDVGEGSREEVSVIEPGEVGVNLQWNRIEGLNGDLTPPYIGVNKRPVIDYSHSEGFAVIGGYVYRGRQFAADLGGRYIFGDNGSKRVWVLDESTTPASKILLATVPPGPGPNPGNDYVGLSSFGIDADNELYMCQMSSTGGRIYKLQRGGPANTPPPALLSQTGVFTNLTTLGASSGLIPYDVASALWSDGALKTRWMGIPATQSINYAPTGEWTFPNGSVFVKHFELPINETNLAIRKRLETRLLVRETNGAVYGLLYKWRADNSDADLLDSAITENVTITTAPLNNLTGIDIGGPALAGTTTPFSGGYQIIGGGTDIWNQSDQFHFAYQQRTGDFDIQTRIESLSQADLYTKAGLMARESLAANSRHVYALVFPSNEARNNNVGGYEFQHRTATGGSSVAIYPAAPQPLVNYPNTWLRLTRRGNSFTAYSGNDGIAWREFATFTLDLPATVYFGLAVTAHSGSSSTTARFHLINTRIQQWYYPSRTDCISCHTPAAQGVLGLKTRQSNRDFHYANTGVTDNQLRAWSHIGLFDSPINEQTIGDLSRLVSVTNTSVNLETRVRSYLDANCSHCHRPGAAQAFWDGRFDTPLERQGIINGSVLNNLGVTGAKVVVPGNTARSIMHRRVGTTEASIRMPPLARNVVDEAAFAALTEWITTLPPTSGEVVLVGAGSAWKYLDNGSNQGTAWRAPDFNDTTWLAGPAELGYGDTADGRPEATMVGFGPNGNDKYITTYFRRAFMVTNAPTFISLSARLLRDDGAVVYLNGVEAFRSNIPTGPVDWTTVAETTVGGADEATFFESPVDAGLLMEGRNVLAVEIHQANNTSSDISFDLDFTGFQALPSSNTPPIVSITSPTNNTTLAVPATVSIVANASDFGGSVTNVAYFAGATPLGADVSGPFEFIWSNVPPGAYALTAVATDNTGLSSTSGVVSVRVTAGNQLPAVAMTSPVNGASFVAPASISLAASASDSDGQVSKVEFYNGATKLGEMGSAPFALPWNNVPAGNYTLTAVATDNSGGSTVSAPVSVSVITAPLLFTNTLVNVGAAWKYLDNGSDQGTAWTALNFNDGGWATGPAQLGYSSNPAENDEATILGFGGDANNKYITTYFRHRFPLTAAASYTNLTVRLLRDDGGVVYLNGVEIFRSNMPTGAVNRLTLASSAVTGAGETTLFFSTNVAPVLLVDGSNIVAVEIHQQSVTSSDISFDLELVGRGLRADDPSVALHGEVASPGVFHIWFGAPTNRVFIIEASGNLETWEPIYTNSAPDGRFDYFDSQGHAWRFYRARSQP